MGLGNYAVAVGAIIKRQLAQGGKVAITGAKYPSLTLSRQNISLNPSHIQSYKNVCGYQGTGVPLMYPAMLCSSLQMSLMTTENFPFPVLGLVHLANSIEQFQIVDPTKKVRIEISLDDEIVFHEKGFCCNVTSQIFSEVDGKLLWKTVMTLLCRAKVPDLTNKVLYESHIKQADLDNAQEVERWTLESSLGRQYAAVSGDYNPIHLSGVSAYLFGFRSGAIIHGMWTKARSLATLMPPIETLQKPQGAADLAPLASAYAEFKTPLFIPSSAALFSKVLPPGEDAETATKLFEVKGATGEMLPYMRGRCSWVQARQ
jgi:acyl dehydratase